MQVNIIAERYAHAFFMYVADDRREHIESVLKMVSEVFDADDNLRKLFSSPAIPVAEKKRILAEIVAKIEPPEEMNYFLQLLLVKERLEILKQISQAFHRLMQEVRNSAIAQVRTAFPLSNEQRASIKEKLERVSGKTLEIVEETDKTLIGGILVRIKDDLYDFSVRDLLNQLRMKLVGQTTS